MRHDLCTCNKMYCCWLAAWDAMELLVLECGVELMDEWIYVTSGDCTGDVVVVKGQSQEQ